MLGLNSGLEFASPIGMLDNSGQTQGSVFLGDGSSNTPHIRLPALNSVFRGSFTVAFWINNLNEGTTDGWMFGIHDLLSAGDYPNVDSAFYIIHKRNHPVEIGKLYIYFRTNQDEAPSSTSVKSHDGEYSVAVWFKLDGDPKTTYNQTATKTIIKTRDINIMYRSEKNV